MLAAYSQRDCWKCDFEGCFYASEITGECSYDSNFYILLIWGSENNYTTTTAYLKKRHIARCWKSWVTFVIYIIPSGVVSRNKTTDLFFYLKANLYHHKYVCQQFWSWMSKSLNVYLHWAVKNEHCRCQFVLSVAAGDYFQFLYLWIKLYQ